MGKFHKTCFLIQYSVYLSGSKLSNMYADNYSAGGQAVNVNPLEALLGGGGGFPPLLDIPPDADDETMVELAIALSLQEHEGLAGGGQQLAAAGVIAGQALQSLQVSIILLRISKLI